MSEAEISVFPNINEAKNELESQFYFYRHTSVKGCIKSKTLLRYNLISLLRSGEKVLYYANKSTTVHDDHFAILSSGNCLMTEKIAGVEPYESVLLLFNNTALTNFFIKYDSVIEKLKKKPATLEEPFVVLKKDHFIENFIASLLHLSGNKASLREEIMQLKFEELMLYLLDKHPAAILSFQASNQDEFSDFKIKMAVEQNITQNLTLKELSFLCNTSISTFKRRFIKLYNETPSQYFLRRKMTMAAELLQRKENPTDIFFKVGYDNYSSFSQSFKQIYGISPKHYQQRN